MAFQRSLSDPSAESLEATFAKVERLVIQAATAKNWADARLAASRERVPAPDRRPSSQATTATVCAVTESAIEVAWVGDSRAVLATRSGSKVAATALTTDHRPEDPGEKARIRALGGGCGRNEKEAFATAKQNLRASVVGAHIVFNVNRKSAHRVFPGAIAVTRALGALPLKSAAPKLVVATPGLASRALDGSEQFLIVACDGIWDVFSDKAACAYVEAALDAGATDAAERLVRSAHAKGSTDNISACILHFKAPTPPPGRVDRYESAGLRGEAEAKTD